MMRRSAGRIGSSCPVNTRSASARRAFDRVPRLVFLHVIDGAGVKAGRTGLEILDISGGVARGGPAAIVLFLMPNLNTWRIALTQPLAASGNCSLRSRSVSTATGVILESGISRKNFDNPRAIGSSYVLSNGLCALVQGIRCIQACSEHKAIATCVDVCPSVLRRCVRLRLHSAINSGPMARHGATTLGAHGLCHRQLGLISRPGACPRRPGRRDLP
jgi:hypothetical protein